MLATLKENNAYERLEGGMGPARPTRKLPWREIAIGCGVLIGLVWFFVPRRDSSTGILQDVYPAGDKISYQTHPGVLQPTSMPTPIGAMLPTSESDPDPLGTASCTTPYAPHLPLVQYALMIDAGSTGSRIHIYKFNHCSPSPAYEHEVFRMTQPGLSGPPYADAQAWTPDDAARSLDVLLDEAVRVVPDVLQGCTPLAVKATAGLRLLGAERSEAILSAVEARVRTYPFVVVADGVGIMDGKDEGVYAWLTVNYLMGRLDQETVAVLDLGGGSTQIVFEPESEMEEGEHRYVLAFGGEERVLYQHSHLGYGLKSAQESVHRLVAFIDRLRTARTQMEEGMARMANPCLTRGTTKEVDVPLENNMTRVLMAGDDVGSFEGCNRVMELVMAKDALCEVKPCSFNGVYQPSMLDAFPTGKILLLSYFYDRIMPLMPTPSGNVQPEINISTIATLARQVCAGPNSWTEHWGTQPEAMDELEDRPEWCLDLTFMHALLGLGYEFTDGQEVSLGKQIEGTELGWCLGATIAMLEGGEVRCKPLEKRCFPIARSTDWPSCPVEES